MNIKSFPTTSDPIYLCDISDKIAAIEDAQNIERDQRVNVVVRQATEADNIARSQMFSRRETSYSGIGQPDKFAVSEVRQQNYHELMMMEAYWTLQEVNHLLGDGDKPVFDKMPAKQMTKEQFKTAWGGLPPVIAEAIHASVLKVNPDWSGLGEF